MSLIPSESYSFPDNYSPVARCWKKPSRKTTSPPQIAPMQRQAMARAAKENGSVISLPEPDRADVFTEPIAETLEAVQAPIAEDEMNGVSVSSPNSAEISFLAALQKMAEQTSSVAPSQEIERVIPPPPTAEINGDSAPPEEEMFLKALAKMVEPKNAPPPPRPALDDTPPPMPADDDAPPSLPPGFKIELWASGIPQARQMAWGKDGTLYVGSFLATNVYAVKMTEGNGPSKPLRRA